MTPYFKDDNCTIYHGDAIEMLRLLPDESVQCCVTSPPFWGLRDYQVDGQLGLEKTPNCGMRGFVVLRDDLTVIEIQEVILSLRGLGLIL